jgi:hypothetical protein
MGYHVCRAPILYDGQNGLNDSLTAMMDASIPYDTDCIHMRLSRYAFRLDDNQVPGDIDVGRDLDILRQAKKKLMLHLPVQVDRESDAYPQLEGLYLMGNETYELEGYFERDYHPVDDEDSDYYDDENVLPTITFSLPDFELTETVTRWAAMLGEFVASNGMSDILAGVSLVHSSPYALKVEPCEEDSQAFPYVPVGLGDDGLDEGTACALSLQGEDGVGRHADQHNSYAQKAFLATSLADGAGQYSFSRHSGPGAGTVGGVYTSDLLPTWSNMKRSLSEVLELNLAGVPLVSMSTCGVYK